MIKPLDIQIRCFLGMDFGPKIFSVVNIADENSMKINGISRFLAELDLFKGKLNMNILIS